MQYTYLIMRHRRLLKKAAALASGALVCAVICYRIDRDLSYVRTYSFAFDRTLSPDAQQAIKQTVADLIHAQQLAPTQLIAQLHKKFLFLRKLAIFTIPGGHGIAKIRCHRPLCIIEGNTALLANGTTLNTQLLSPQMHAETPAVEVHDWFAGDGGIPAQLASFLKALGKEKLMTYHVTWRGDHEALLTDRETPTFSLLVDPHQPLSDTLLGRCEEVKELLTQRGLINAPRKRHWTADARFKNQIIVFAGKRGGEHGTRSF